MLQTSWGFATLPFDLWGKPHDRLETRVVGGAILTNVKPREETTHPEISQPFRFPGQYHDEETGLYYNRYRYYMPGEGMYTQRDPIGLAGGNPTVYGYVFDTLQEVDPWGLILRPISESEINSIIDEIGRLAYRNKRILPPGEGGGTHGIVHRFREQITGRMRPPNPGWDTHQTAIKNQQRSLSRLLKTARDKGFIDRVLEKYPNIYKVSGLNLPKPTAKNIPTICK